MLAGVRLLRVGGDRHGVIHVLIARAQRPAPQRGQRPARSRRASSTPCSGLQPAILYSPRAIRCTTHRPTKLVHATLTKAASRRDGWPRVRSARLRACCALSPNVCQQRISWRVASRLDTLYALAAPHSAPDAVLCRDAGPGGAPARPSHQRGPLGSPTMATGRGATGPLGKATRRPRGKGPCMTHIWSSHISVGHVVRAPA